jgi:predicted thioesterase
MINLEIGLENSIEQEVEYKDTAAAYGSGLLEVFATPAMIALMENCCLQSIEGSLPKGYSSVGIELNIRHLKATKINDKVKCVSKLVEIDRLKLTFEVEAFDNNGKIGMGTHKRFVVENEKFLKSL